MSDKVSDKVSDKEQYFFTTFLTLVEQNGFVTTKAIAEVIKMPETTARRYLAKLCKLDIIVSDVIAVENLTSCYYRARIKLIKR